MKLLTQVKDKGLMLSGDGRCDSPGKSAKYCTYSFMDVDSGYILHMETVDKREVALQSPNMEKEALVRSLDFLLPHITCKEIITDASSSIRHELGMLNPSVHSPIIFSYSHQTSGYNTFSRCMAQVKEIEEGFG